MFPKKVSLITGFLGAGKTTLINNIISELTDVRFCVVENEFGAVGLDKELITAELDTSVFQLSNGCLCCSLNGDLVDLLKQLIDLGDSYDHLIIETTGIAEPDAIAKIFLTEPEVQQYFELDSCICVVDSYNFEINQELRAEAKKQIAFSDTYYLSKRSDDNKASQERITKELNTVNPQAEIITEINKNLINRASFEAGQLDITVHNPGHTTSMRSYSFVFEDKPFDMLKIRQWFNVLIAVQSTNIYRVKGILWIHGLEESMVIQSVHKTALFQKGKEFVGAPSSKIVLIGEELDKEVIEKYLRKCLISDNMLF